MMLATFAIALFVPWFLDQIPEPMYYLGGGWGGGGGGVASIAQLIRKGKGLPPGGPPPRGPPPGHVRSEDSEDGVSPSTNMTTSLGSLRRWKRETSESQNDVEKGW